MACRRPGLQGTDPRVRLDASLDLGALVAASMRLAAPYTQVRMGAWPCAVLGRLGRNLLSLPVPARQASCSCVRG